MADLSDVEQALGALIGTIVYPAGTAVTPSGPAPGLLGQTRVEIFRGWPQAADLTKDLAAAAANVSIYSEPAGSRDTSRYFRAWQTVSTAAATMTATVAGNVATFAGAATAGQVVGLLAAGIGFSYAIQAGDTPSAVAAALAAAIAADGRLLALASGPSITVTDLSSLPLPVNASVSGSATSQAELRRQEQRLMVTTWCATPQARDTLAGGIDAALAAIDFITLADGTEARIRYTGTRVSDSSSQATLYRRDLLYVLEYATTATQTVPTVVFPIGGLHVAGVNTSFGMLPAIAGIQTDGQGDILVDAAGQPLVQTAP